jgi:ATP-binding cassette subfamily F protein 3
MMFEGDAALKKVKFLSGGEKSRVLLGKILCSSTNLLLLDEPTNHFDMQSCDSILEAMDSYPGGIIIATHNEMFLHSIPNKLVVFDHDRIVVFEGTYADFLEKIGWDNENTAKDKKNDTNKGNKYSKDTKKQRAEIIEEKSKKIKPIENKIKSVESQIVKDEDDLHKTQTDFEAATFENNGLKIKELSIKIAKLEDDINKHYLELDQLTRDYEEQLKVYEEKLNSI